MQKPPLRRFVIRRATSKEIAEERSAAYKACLVTRRMIIAPYSFFALRGRVRRLTRSIYGTRGKAPVTFA
jgi:hypothetical protein